LKTLEQATEIRRRILLAYENAESAAEDKEEQRRLLTFVVVGGGPTGVELAGAIAEISRKTLVADFDNIDPSRSRVILVEGGDRILAGFSPELSRKAALDLEEMGVTVWSGSMVTEITDKGVKVGNDFIAANTVVWAAGVKPAALLDQLHVEQDSLGRVFVNGDLTVPGHDNVFVAGDSANCKGEDGKPLPGLAPVASQQGRYVAKCIVRDLQNKPRKEFHYTDKGMMATIGRKRAVAEVGSLKISGVFAWLAWLFVHIYYLIGFKNKAFVLFSWAWQYFTFKKSARLIISKDWKETS
jgi:NADH dehydrogenase